MSSTLGTVLKELADTSAFKGTTAMLTGILTLPWGQLAFIVAIIYNLHLIVGWWYDRLGLKDKRRRQEREQRKLELSRLKQDSNTGPLT